MALKSENYYPLTGTLEIAALRGLLGKDNPTILEIGANSGQTTLEFLQHFPRAQIFCFEPEPRAISKFKATVKSPNVTLVETAIGNQVGSVTFNQSTGEGAHHDWDYSGSIRKPTGHFQAFPGVEFKTTIDVPITKLDTWAKDNQLGPVDFIWADVQGAETDLIAGGQEVLCNTPFFYTEYGTSEWYEGQAGLDQLSELLFPLGHVLNLKFPIDALFINRNRFDISALPFPLIPGSACPCGSGADYVQCHGKNFAGDPF